MNQPSAGTLDDRRFQAYLERSEPYVAAIREAGDVPWWEDPERVARLETRVPGISEMTTTERRRALWDRKSR